MRNSSICARTAFHSVLCRWRIAPRVRGPSVRQWSGCCCQPLLSDALSSATASIRTLEASSKEAVLVGADCPKRRRSASNAVAAVVAIAAAAAASVIDGGDLSMSIVFLPFNLVRRPILHPFSTATLQTREKGRERPKQMIKERAAKRWPRICGVRCTRSLTILLIDNPLPLGSLRATGLSSSDSHLLRVCDRSRFLRLSIPIACPTVSHFLCLVVCLSLCSRMQWQKAERLRPSCCRRESLPEGSFSLTAILNRAIWALSTR